MPQPFFPSAVCAVALLGLAALAQAEEQPTIRERMGGGNFTTGQTAEQTADRYFALRELGARSSRMNSYGWRDLDRKPTPEDFDAAMLEAYKQGVKPVIHLEYYGNYKLLNPPQPIGSYEDWFQAGRAVAKRFGRGGDWAKENNAGDWGVDIFAAINEPDVESSIPHDAYRYAMAGYADGVHSINEEFRVVPGGFATCNSHGDPTFRGYGTAIADLLNDGRLDGLDFHTYYHVRWYPIERGREFSAQRCFDKAKEALGIKRDINFYATEFNTARLDGWDDDRLMGSLFLTGIWDQLGVVKGSGASATVIAFPWNIADTPRVDGPAYAMATHENPWRPDVRSKVLKMVLDLAGDMRFVDLDPKGSGTYVLEDDKSRIVVLQNRPGWTDRQPGSMWTVTAPQWAAQAELWAWDGKRGAQSVTGGQAVTFELPGDETYILRFIRP